MAASGVRKALDAPPSIGRLQRITIKIKGWDFVAKNAIRTAVSPVKAKAVRKEYLAAILFVLPSVLVMLYMVYYPIINSVYLSFFKWNGISPNKEFVGLANYAYVFTDPKYAKAMQNNLIWMVIHILFACMYGLVLAFLVSRIRKFKTVFRVILFLPNVVATSVAAIMWTMIYNPQYGIVVVLLRALGIDTSRMMMLGDPNLAIFLTALASCWQGYGYYMMLFLAGLQNIDETLYEAAEIDGAGSFQQFRHITIPGLNNVFSFVLSIAIIHGLRGFSTVYVMTEGGPGSSTYLVAVYSYIKAFREQSMGTAMVSALINGIIIIIITMIFNVIREKRED